MAKTKGPLLSLEAHGSLAKTLNYSQKRTGSQCRKYNKPLVAPTPTQRARRRLTDFLVAHWQGMTTGQKAAWETRARAAGLSLAGYHYFLRAAQRDLYTEHGLVAFWPLNKIVSNTVLDYSGNGHTFALRPSPPSDAPVLVPSMNTKLNNALYFDGVNDALKATGTTKLKVAGNFTLSYWVKFASLVGEANKSIFTVAYTLQ